MERRVEYRDIGLTWHEFHASLDALDVGRVVQRPELDILADAVQHFLVYKRGLRELFTAVKHTVTDRLNLVHGLDRAVFRVRKRLDDFQHRRAVIGHVLFEDELFLARRRVRQCRTFDANPLDQAFRLHGFGVHIDQLIFDRRAAGVNDQDVCHTTFLP